jgi:hypothetical protein
MTFRKSEDQEIERRSTKSHSVENSLWKRLWTRRKIDYIIRESKKISARQCSTFRNISVVFISSSTQYIEENVHQTIGKDAQHQHFCNISHKKSTDKKLHVICIAPNCSNVLSIWSSGYYSHIES